MRRFSRNNCNVLSGGDAVESTHNAPMRFEYKRQSGSGLTYEVEVDRHGSYAIKLNEKVLKRVTALPKYVGKPRWGSKKLEADAADDAINAIESFKTDFG
jgi:hypothetical protein